MQKLATNTNVENYEAKQHLIKVENRNGKYVTAHGDKSVQKRCVKLRINARARDLWRTPGIRKAPHQAPTDTFYTRATLNKHMQRRMGMRVQELLIASTCHPIVVTGNLTTDPPQ